MIRQMVRSAALFAAGALLAGGAWGQSPVLRQATSDVALLATEYFGEARVVQASNMSDQTSTATVTERRPYVALNLTGAAVTVGNQAEITFQLSGATFDQAASPTNLDRRGVNCADPIGTDIEASVANGGERGSTSVTYSVEVKDTGGVTALAVDTAICFWLPDLSVTLATVSAPGATPAERGVNVTASIKPTTATGTPFPGKISGPAAMDIDTDESGAVDGTEVGNAPNTDLTVFKATPALVTSLGMGDTVYVNIADRTKIAADGGGTPDPSVTGPNAMLGLRVGTLTLSLSQENIWMLNGSGFLSKTQLDSSLSGQVDLTVGGRYQSGDALVVGSGPTALKGVINGMIAEVSVPMEPTTGMPIVYVPGGVDNLKPGKFMAGGAYLFNDRRNANAALTSMSEGEIKYAGLEVEGYAYGVVRSAENGGMDTSYVRVTCEAAMDCHIFADCAGQDGTEYFGGPVVVEAGTTGVVTSDQIGTALGGGWAKGRGHCDLHSSGQLSVQHMIRSHDLLINSSVVVGRGLDESRDARIAVIDQVVDNICESVVGHYGREGDLDGGDDNPATLTDNISAHDATPCKNVLARVIADTVDTNSMGTDDTANGL